MTTATGQLTHRERKVLLLKANGYTSKRASEETGLTRCTIDGIMETIFLRLGVTNCPQAVAVALKLEEIDMDKVELSLIRHVKETS